MDDITHLLQQIEAGDRRAVDMLVPLVYAELREIASVYLRSEPDGHTLQPTALVNEAYMKLVNQREVQWKSRSHFLGIAAQAMRRILVDHARRHHAAKRDRGALLELHDSEVPDQPSAVDIVALNNALTRLAAFDERQAKLVELRFFGGLNIEDTATIMDISTATVKREWRAARAWLKRELAGETGAD